MHSSPISPSCPTYKGKCLLPPPPRLASLSHLSLIPKDFCLDLIEVCYLPKNTHTHKRTMNIPGKLTSKSCSLHHHDFLTGFVLDVHIKKGRDNKNITQPRKNDPNKQPVSPKCLVSTGYNLLDQKIHPFNRTSLCISLALALVVWESLDLTGRSFDQLWVTPKGSHPRKMLPRLEVLELFLYNRGVSGKKGYPIIVVFHYL